MPGIEDAEELQPSVASRPAVRPTTARCIAGVPLIDFVALLGIGAVFIATLTYLGELRFENFFATNWDLGINMQMLWTTTHGRLLYETGDAEFYNVWSFLQVHSTYIAVPFAALYGLVPYPSTLFALQAGAFVASIVPLYWLARRLIENRKFIFLIIALYLTSFPVLSALLYDYHWEAFLPVEFLSFFLLYRERRFAWSLLPLFAGLLTLEVFPFLVGGVGLLVLYERLGISGIRGRALLRDRDLRVAIALLAGMLVAYVAERYVQILVIPRLIGYPGTTGPVSSAITEVFAFHATIGSLVLSASYWLLIFAAFAFLPLFAPRYLLLTVPWFIYSTLLSPFFTSQFGNQYALIAVTTFAVPLVYGSAQLEKMAGGRRPWTMAPRIVVVSSCVFLFGSLLWSRDLLSRTPPIPLYALLILPPAFIVVSVVLSQARLQSESEPGAVPVRTFRTESRRWRRPLARRTVAGAALLVFLGFNIAMSPLNTVNLGATVFPGYQLKYTTNPASGEMGWLTSWIPPDAVVLTSDCLFPYVANNPHAWAVPWYPMTPGNPPLYFPFSATNLPKFVLIDAVDWFNFPTSISSQLSNPSQYGLVAFIYTSGYPGTIALYELGYSGHPAARFESAFAPALYYSASNLSLGPAGVLRRDAQSKFGEVIVSIAAPAPSFNESRMWGGPGVSLPPMDYTLTLNFSANAFVSGLDRPVLNVVIGTSSAPPLYNFTVNAQTVSSKGWMSLTWAIYMPVAVPDMEIGGFLDYTNGTANGNVTLNYLEIES